MILSKLKSFSRQIDQCYKFLSNYFSWNISFSIKENMKYWYVYHCLLHLIALNMEKFWEKECEALRKDEKVSKGEKIGTL